MPTTDGPNPCHGGRVAYIDIEDQGDTTHIKPL